MAIINGSHPPKVRLAIRVGVTGHRLNRLQDADFPALHRRIIEALTMVRNVGKATAADPLAGYESGEPVFTVISPLAEGSDRLVAEAALELGFELQSPLPFPRENYEKDFTTPESLSQFRKLLDRATAVLELDGSRENPQSESHAFESVGRTVLRHSDVLIAIWDGSPPTKRGGTAQIAREAAHSHIPVIWINSESPYDACLLGASEKGEPLRIDLNQLPKFLKAFLYFDQPKSHGSLGKKIRDLRPHYFHEVTHRWTLGVLFNVFSKLVAGRKPWPLSFFVKDYEDETRKEWVRAWSVSTSLPSDSTRQVEEGFLLHYAWADKLANHYANIYRSSFVANYLLAALAVLFALKAYFAEPKTRLWTWLELASIVFIIGITTLGRYRHWHERWIDYRLLAEKFRHMRFLFLIGRVSVTERVPEYEAHGEELKSWVDWHFQAVVRETGILHGKMDASYRKAYRKLLADHEMADQIEYHAKNSLRSLRIDRRLQLLAISFFFGTLVVCIIHLLVKIDDEEKHKLLVQLAAVLPAFGAAIHGIESQGDFHHVAHRSSNVGKLLTDIVASLNEGKADLSSDALGDIAERAADVMGAELADWRTGFQDKPLEFPV